MVYAAVSISGSQKGDNFQVMDPVLTGPFDITQHRRQSIVVGVGGRKSQNSRLVNRRFIFLLPSLFAQNAAFASLG